MSSQMYKETEADKIVIAQVARKRASLMQPQETFNCDYFSDIVSYIALDDSGKVTLHTKVETEIIEGDGVNGCNEDAEENSNLN